MVNVRQIVIIFRISHTLFGELAAAMLISLPLSETVLLLTGRLTLFIMSFGIVYFIEDLLYDKSE